MIKGIRRTYFHSHYLDQNSLSNVRHKHFLPLFQSSGLSATQSCSLCNLPKYTKMTIYVTPTTFLCPLRLSATPTSAKGEMKATVKENSD